MVGHIPRAEHANRLIAATQAGGAPGITHADLYEHHAEHRARSAKAAA
jgi:hypothetical protein